MTRRNIATILCLAAATSLVLTAGCKKAKKSDDTKKSAGAMTAPMKGAAARPAPDKGSMKAADAMGAMAVTPPAKALGPGRKGALPIPADYPMVTIFLKAARQTPLFKQYEAKLKGLLTSAMGKQKGLDVLVKKCKLDFFGNVDSVSLSRSPSAMDPDNTMLILNGSFDAPKLLTCAGGAMKAAKVAFKDVTVAGKKGYTITLPNGKTATALALGPKAIVLIGQTMLPRATSVLDGKLKSIEDTSMFADGMKQLKAKPATVFAALVPVVPAALLAKIERFPVAKKIRSAKAMIGMPAGGLELNAMIDFTDAKTAKMVAKTLPALLGIVKAKLGALGVKLLKNLKIGADGNAVKIALALDKATFGELKGFATKMLGSVMGGMTGGSAKPAPAPMKAAPMKAAPAKGMK